MLYKMKINFEVKAIAYSSLNLSIYHLMSSAFFLKKSTEIENTYSNSTKNISENEHRSYVMGSIFSIVASLEATINEFLIEALNNSEDFFTPLRNVLKNWELIENKELTKILESGKILDKYQLALKSFEKQILNKGTDPYQSVNDFIALRNSLTHYKPEYHETKNINLNLEKKLHNKFSLNPFQPIAPHFFPSRCLSSGCAKWGLIKCEKLIEDFFLRIDLKHFIELRKNIVSKIVLLD